MSDLNKHEPPPRINEHPAVWPLVIEDAKRLYALTRRLACRQLVEDMRHRDDTGALKYGTQLQPWNGRNQLVDAYQEALDLCVYLRAAMCEGAELVDLYEKALAIALELRARLGP